MQLRTLLDPVIHPSPDSYALVRTVFVRLLGVVYLIAFASFGVQMAGLVGSEGILPAAEFLEPSAGTSSGLVRTGWCPQYSGCPRRTRRSPQA